jgi:hypothetical protein
MDDGRPTHGIVAFVVTAALLMLGFDAFRATYACSLDTSYCAETTDRNGLYTGTLRDPEGRPAANTEFEVHFASRGLDRPRVRFKTDARGRYCILWPKEDVFPSSQVAENRSVSLNNWSPLENMAPPKGCQEGDAGVPWQRADDLASSWQFLTLVALPALALALLGAGIANVRRRGLLWARLAATLTVVSLLAYVWLWAP